MYLFDNVIDMDFGSMYPNIIIAFNIERCTMIFKLVLENVMEDDPYDHKFIGEQNVNSAAEDFYEDDEDDGEEKEVDLAYDAGKDFVDNLLTGDYQSLGTIWFNLPTFDELNKEFKNKFEVDYDLH